MSVSVPPPVVTTVSIEGFSSFTTIIQNEARSFVSQSETSVGSELVREEVNDEVMSETSKTCTTRHDYAV
jgi:hypothetical protein